MPRPLRGPAGRARWLVCALLMGEAQATESDSDGGPARIRSLREQADRSFQARDYDRALRALEEGFVLSRDATFVFNLGATHHARGDCVRARDSYARYLALAPQGAQRQAARQALGALRPVCGAPPVIESSHDPPDRPPSVAPPSPVGPRSGRHSTAAARRPLELAPPLLASEPVSRPAVWAADPTLAWSLVGAGAVAALLGGATAVLWSEASSDQTELVRSAIAQDRPWDECCLSAGRRLEDERRRYARLSVGLGLASVLLAGVGTTLLVVEVDASAPLGGIRASYRARF